MHEVHLIKNVLEGFASVGMEKRMKDAIVRIWNQDTEARIKSLYTMVSSFDDPPDIDDLILALRVGDKIKVDEIVVVLSMSIVLAMRDIAPDKHLDWWYDLHLSSILEMPKEKQ